MTRRGLRRILLGLVILLYVLSIPWYREAGSAGPTIAGMPDWVAVAVACYVAAAVLNAWAWALTEIPEDDPGEDA